MLLLLSACAPAAVSGSAQKGPLLLGSTVQVASLDEGGEPTGDVYATETTDDLGTFALTVDDTGPVALTAEGFQYDELAGALSAAPITLRAVGEIVAGGDQAIFVSPVTHLAAARTKALMSSGLDVADAGAQADAELVAALGIGRPASTPARRARSSICLAATPMGTPGCSRSARCSSRWRRRRWVRTAPATPRSSSSSTTPRATSRRMGPWPTARGSPTRKPGWTRAG